MKYHSDEACCVKLEAVVSILRDIKVNSTANIEVVHKSDSAIQLIEELFVEFNDKE